MSTAIWTPTCTWEFCVKTWLTAVFPLSPAMPRRVPADSLRDSRSLSYSPPRHMRAALPSPSRRSVATVWHLKCFKEEDNSFNNYLLLTVVSDVNVMPRVSIYNLTLTANSQRISLPILYLYLYYWMSTVYSDGMYIQIKWNNR